MIVMKLNNTGSHYLSPHGKFGRKPFIACDECFGSISGLAQLGFCWWVFLCWGSETPIIASARQKPVYLSANIAISCSHVYYDWTLTWKVVRGEGLLKIRACVDLLTKWELAMSVDYMTILALKNTGFWRANAIIGVSHPQHTKKTQPPAKTQQKNSQAKPS